MLYVSFTGHNRQLRLVLAVIMTVALAITSLNATAENFAEHGYASLQTFYDSGSTRDVLLDLSVSAGNKTRLTATIGNTNGDESAVGVGDELDLDYWDIGIGHEFTDEFTFKISGGSSGQDQDINIKSVNINMNWTGQNWLFSLRPQFRELELLFFTMSGPRIIDINSKGIGTSIGYLGIDRWEIIFSYDSYDYDRNTRLLNIPFIVNRFSSKALTAASGIKDHGYDLSVTRLFSESDITVSFGQNKSAIDGTTSDAVSLNMNFYQFDPVTIGIEAGGIDSQIDDASYYAGLTFGYFW